MHSPRDLIGAFILSDREWLVTDVSSDGMVTLAHYAGPERTLIAGNFVGPDLMALRLVEEITLPAQSLLDAVRSGLVELLPRAEDSTDASPKEASSEPAKLAPFDVILCADWSRQTQGRAVYIALPQMRIIKRLHHSLWTFVQLLTDARAIATGPVLIAVDAPIGIPRSFVRDDEDGVEFTRWLRRAAEHPDFFRPCIKPEDWSPARPFFSASAGIGGLTRWFDRMREHGVEPFREIDQRTGAKSMFVTSGIPGTVGHSTQDIWKAILANRRRISVWPFDGTLKDLSDTDRPVVAEIYPRAMYGIALSDQRIDQRPRRRISKTDPDCRRAAVDNLMAQHWIKKFEVQLLDVEHARQNENDFDALLSAAALLRCVLEETPLGSAYEHRLEGGMLASLSLNIHLGETLFPTGSSGAPARGDFAPSSNRGAHASEILKALNWAKTRVTYGAVAATLGCHPQSVGKHLGMKRPEAAWVVNAATGLPTGYSRAQMHPDLEGSPIIRTQKELRLLLDRCRKDGA